MRQPVLQHRCCGLKVLHQQDFQTFTPLRQNPRMRFCRMRQPVLQHRCCGLKVLHQQDFQTFTPLRQNPRMRFCRMRQPVLQHRCCGLKVLHQQDFQTFSPGPSLFPLRFSASAPAESPHCPSPHEVRGSQILSSTPSLVVSRITYCGARFTEI